MNVSEMSAPQQTMLIKNYNSCFKQLNHTTEPDLTQILSIVNDWAPKTDLICLYVRWAKKLKANFHLDSIATLLTVAKQCGYPALQFLDMKTLQVAPRNQQKRRSAGPYGVSFSFVSTDEQKSNFIQQFIGFLVTLQLLESSVVGSRAVNGKVGMRNSGPRTPSQILLLTGDGNDGNKTAVLGVPTTEFHKEQSLICRVWSDIHHRWIALRVVEYLMDATGFERDDLAALQYSFQMNAEASRSRFDWLDPYAFVTLISSPSTLTRQIWLTFGKMRDVSIIVALLIYEVCTSRVVKPSTRRWWSPSVNSRSLPALSFTVVKATTDG
jgi:hypothetical protein